MSPLMSLLYHEPILNTPVDPMHLFKNVVSHAVNLIANHDDTIKVRRQEEHLGRFPTSWIKNSC